MDSCADTFRYIRYPKEAILEIITKIGNRLARRFPILIIFFSLRGEGLRSLRGVFVEALRWPGPGWLDGLVWLWEVPKNFQNFFSTPVSPRARKKVSKNLDAGECVRSSL